MRYQGVWQKGWPRWRRLTQDQVPDVLSDLPDFFVTAQLFSRPAPSDGEPHLCGPYFDLDADGDLARALSDARRIAEYFRKLGLADEGQRWNFSGKKGFHCVTSHHVFGVSASPDATAIARRCAAHLQQMLGLSTVDFRVYSVRRLLRIPGTVHHGSGLRAIPLSVEELLTFSVEQILAAAEQPGAHAYAHRVFPEEDQDEGLADWWDCYAASLKVARDLGSGHKNRLKPFDLQAARVPVCLSELQRGGLEGLSGGRNEATFLYALGLAAGGVPEQQAWEHLREWTIAVHLDVTGRCPPPGRVLSNAESTVRSGYTKGRWWSCDVARSLGCQCNHDACQYLERDEKPAAGESTFLSLAQAVDATHAGKEIEIEGIVIGRDRTPILMPAEAVISCNPDPDNSTCQKCKLLRTGQQKVSIYDQLWAAMPMAMAGRDKRDKLFSAMARIPTACPGHRVTHTRNGNMTFAAIQPDVKVNLNGQQIWRENDVAVLTSSIEDQAIYSFKGQTHDHPKTSRAVTVAHTFRKKSSDIDTFKLTEEDHKELSVFQAKEGKVWEKVQDIHEEWEHLVHGIHGRSLQAIGLSLAWFSPLAFRLGNRDVPRGWIEVLALGDTGQGKSELATSYQRLMGAGYFISGENLSLAGLIAGVDKVNNQYVYRLGALPRNDRGLVIFEEWGAVKEDAKRSLSDVRSSGLARLNKIISLSVAARCRKVILANPIANRRSVWMGSKAFPIEHVLEVMGHSPEDVRRLDLVVGLASSEEIRQEIYRKHPVYEREGVYTPERARKLCRWVWSRKPEQILFTPQAVEDVDDFAEGFSREYSREIPLWDPGDSRNKVARLASALAGETFSTEDGSDLVVTHHHVRAVSDLVHGLYNSADLGFLEFSYINNEKQRISHEDLIEASIALASSRSKAALEFFTHNDVLQQKDLVHACDMTDPEANMLLNQMRRKYLIIRKGIGFKLNNRGVQVVKAILAHIRDHDGRWPHGVEPDTRFKVAGEWGSDDD